MIYSNNTEIIRCGDININYLIVSTHIQLLDLLLASYGLCSRVQFPTTLTLRLTIFLLLHLNLMISLCLLL